MKPIRHILLAAIFTVAVFTAVTYTACKEDKCANVICLNLGSCDGGVCKCRTGFEGDRCQTFSRDKFVKIFNGADSCAVCPTCSDYRQYPIHFKANLADPQELVMHNILNNPDDSAECTVWRTDSFTFLGSNNATSYHGYGAEVSYSSSSMLRFIMLLSISANW
jgi:hypothetical protein